MARVRLGQRRSVNDCYRRGQHVARAEVGPGVAGFPTLKAFILSSRFTCAQHHPPYEETLCAALIASMG